MKVSEQIIEVINALCEKFGLAIDWSAENILPYLEQLGGKVVSYEIATSIFWICFLVFLVAIFGVLSWVANKEYWDAECVFVPLLIVTAIISCVIIPCEVIDIIEATTFPEKVIYEFFSEAISNLK